MRLPSFCLAGALAASLAAPGAFADDDEPRVKRRTIEAVTAEEFLALALGREVWGNTIPDGRRFVYRLKEDGSYQYELDGNELYAPVVDAGEGWEAPGGFCFQSTAGRFEGCRRIIKTRGELYHVVDERGRLRATWAAPEPVLEE